MLRSVVLVLVVVLVVVVVVVVMVVVVAVVIVVVKKKAYIPTESLRICSGFQPVPGCEFYLPRSIENKI